MNRFCSQCGVELQPENDFCTNCGQACGAAPGPEDPKVLMVLPQAQRHTGFLGLQSIMNILVITQKQIFILETPPELQKQIDEMEDQLQNRGSAGLLDDHEFIKAYDFSQAPWQIYARLPLQEEHLTVETASIQKVEVAMHDGWRDDTLRFYLPGETIKFDLMWPLGEIALEALRIALGDRVKDVS